MAVCENAQLKLNRLDVVFGSEWGAAEHRANNHFKPSTSAEQRHELG